MSLVTCMSNLAYTVMIWSQRADNPADMMSEGPERPEAAPKHHGSVTHVSPAHHCRNLTAPPSG